MTPTQLIGPASPFGNSRDPVVRAGPMVRIRFPPAESPLRTRLPADDPECFACARPSTVGCRESCDAQSADWRSEYFRSVSTRAWEAVHKVAQVDVGGLAEGIAFSPDGGYLYVGNFVDGDVDILRVDGDTLV